MWTGVGMSKEESLDEKISKFVEFHDQKAFAERQLEALKKWFKADSGDEDTTYESEDGTQIHVTWGETTRFDNAKLDAHLGDEAQDFKTTTSHQKVTVVKAKKGAA